MENSIEQVSDEATAAPAPSLGVMLREAREHLGLSVADVAGQIKFAPRQIEALEDDDFQQLPEMAFVRGFVRSYARILQLEPQPLLALLPQPEFVAPELKSASVEAPFPTTRSQYRQNLIWLGAALVLAVLVVIFAVWHYTTPQAQVAAMQTETAVSSPAGIQVTPASPVAEAGQAVAAASAVVPASPGPSKPQASPKVSADQAGSQAPSVKPAALSGVPLPAGALRLVFDDESWVEARGKDGQILTSQINPRGSELRLDAQAPLSLVIGRASSVHLFYRGKQIDLAPHTSTTGDVARLTLE